MTATCADYIAIPPPLVNHGARESTHNNLPHKTSPHWRAVLLALGGEPLGWKTYPEIGATVATAGPPGNRLCVGLIQAAPRDPALYRAALCASYRAPRNLGFTRSLPLAEAQRAATAWLIAEAGLEWVSSAELVAAVKRRHAAEEWTASPATAWQRCRLARRAPSVIVEPRASAGETAALIDAVFIRRQVSRVRRALYPGAAP